MSDRLLMETKPSVRQAGKPVAVCLRDAAAVPLRGGQNVPSCGDPVSPATGSFKERHNRPRDLPGVVVKALVGCHSGRTKQHLTFRHKPGEGFRASAKLLRLGSACRGTGPEQGTGRIQQSRRRLAGVYVVVEHAAGGLPSFGGG